jgi:hypothetical protein
MTTQTRDQITAGLARWAPAQAKKILESKAWSHATEPGARALLISDCIQRVQVLGATREQALAALAQNGVCA